MDLHQGGGRGAAAKQERRGRVTTDLQQVRRPEPGAARGGQTLKKDLPPGWPARGVSGATTSSRPPAPTTCPHETVYGAPEDVEQKPATKFRLLQALSLEGISQMDSILPERLPALVRPGNDLVLRRIRSLKRCAQACGCKIMTPRYALQFGSRLHFKRCQALPKKTPVPFFFGTLFFWNPFFLFFCFFLALQRLARLKCNLEPNCKHI